VPEDLILDCYRLAKYYSRNPQEFLDMPLTDIMKHMHWTGKLVEATAPKDDDASE
jgi:hypothetical protein